MRSLEEIFGKAKKKLLGTAERPTALRFLPEEMKRTMEPVKKVLEFLTPESPEEAKKYGMLPIYKGFKKEGELMGYLDPLGAIAGLKRIGPKAAKIVGAERVAMEAKALAKRGISKAVETVDDIIRQTKEPTIKKIPEVTKSFMKEARTQIVDRFYPIQNFVRKVEQTIGKRIVSEEDPYVAARLYQGVMGKVQNKLDDLGRIIRIAGIYGSNEVKQLSRSLLAERIKERAMRGFANPRNLGIKEADEIINAVKLDPKYPQIQKAQEAIYRYADDLLLKTKEAGIIDDATHELIKSKNQKYTPFDVIEYLYDEVDKLPAVKRTFNIATQDAIKAIKGTTKDIADPLEAFVRKTTKIVTLIERNDVAKKLVDLRKLNPAINEFIRPLKFKATEIQKLPKDFEKISIFDAGVKQDFAVPAEVADAMKGLTSKSVDVITRSMSFFSRLFRAGVTTINASFFIPNTIRDVQTAITVSKSGLRVLADLPSGFASAIGRGKLYREWREGGGAFSTMVSQYAPIRTTLKDITQSKTRGFIKTIINPVRLLQEVSRIFEEGTRLAVFKGAKRLEGIPLRAAMESRQATVDFARMGGVMRIANMWIPFLNARLQGTLNIARAIRERPIRTLMKATTIVSMPTIATYLWNRSQPSYWDIPQYVKDYNFIISLGEYMDAEGKKQPKYIKIPKGDIGRYLGNPLENFLVYLEGRDPKALSELALQFFSDLSPLGFEREGKLSVTRFMGEVLPPPIKTAAEIATGKVFFTGLPMIPKKLEKVKPELQAKEWTSPVAKKLGQLLGVSPIKLEHGIRGIFGEVGTQALLGLDVLAEQLGVTKPSTQIKEPTYEEKLARAPVLRRFIGTGGGATEDRAWEIIEGAEIEYNSIRLVALGLYKEGKSQEALQRIKDWNQEIKNISNELKALGYKDIDTFIKKVSFQPKDIQNLRQEAKVKEIPAIEKRLGGEPTKRSLDEIFSRPILPSLPSI